MSGLDLAVLGSGPVIIVKLITASLLGIVIVWAGWKSWKIFHQERTLGSATALKLIQLALLPISAYLLLASTVHPWYITIVIPFLPFYLDQAGRAAPVVWAWIYLSIAAAFSYLAYLDPENPLEREWVRLLEYLPFYGLLIWAAVKTWARKGKTELIQTGEEIA